MRSPMRACYPARMDSSHLVACSLARRCPLRKWVARHGESVRPRRAEESSRAHVAFGHPVASAGLAGDHHRDRDRGGEGSQGEPAHQARGAREVASDRARPPRCSCAWVHAHPRARSREHRGDHPPAVGLRGRCCALCLRDEEWVLVGALVGRHAVDRSGRTARESSLLVLRGSLTGWEAPGEHFCWDEERPRDALRRVEPGSLSVLAASRRWS